MRGPTEGQYRKLRSLGSGAAVVCQRRREWEPLLRRGWVEQEPETSLQDNGFPAFLRITPNGTRALADGIERYGLPPLTRVAEKEAA